MGWGRKDYAFAEADLESLEIGVQNSGTRATQWLIGLKRLEVMIRMGLWLQTATVQIPF